MKKNYLITSCLLVLAGVLLPAVSGAQCTASISTALSCGGVPARLQAEMNRAIQYLEWSHLGTGVIRRDTAVHEANGVTVFGTGTSGTGLNQVTRTGPIFLHTNGDIYVGDEGNHRVLKFSPGSATGVVVAGHATAGAGSSLDRVNHTTGVYVGERDTVYVLEFGNNRITKWGPGVTQGILVVNDLSQPIGFSVRPDGTIYVVELGGQRVRKILPGATTSTTVESLNGGAMSIAFDAVGDMYVAMGDGAIRKYPQGATPATVVVTPYNGIRPRGIAVDKYFNIWVAADNNGHKVVRYAYGSSGYSAAQTIVGDGNGGNGAHQVNNPCSLFLNDSTGSLYVADYGNHRIQRYAARIKDTLTVGATGQYNIVAKGFSGCTETAGITISNGSGVGITPGSNPSVCAGATTASLSYSGATGTPNQYSIAWNSVAQAAGFTAVTNQALSGGAISLAVPSGVTAGNTYSGTLTVRNSTTGCVSNMYNMGVSVTTGITVTPGNNPSVCVGAASASLPYTATGSPNQYSITWNSAAQTAGFTNVTNQALSGSVVNITVPATASPATYSGTLTMRNNSTGCISAASNISVVVHELPAATVTPSGHVDVCVGQTVTLTAGSGTGYSYEWKNAQGVTGSGGSYDAGVTGDYYVVVTDGNNCRDSSAGVSVTQVSLPQASIVPGDTSFCTGGFVRLEVVSADTGLGYQWKKDNNQISATAGFLEVNATGIYSVIVTRNSLAGCTDSTADVQITVHPLPTPPVNWDGTILTTGTSYDTYQWHISGQPIVAATNDSYRPDTVGSYSVTVTDSNGCSNTSSSYQVNEIAGVSTSISAAGMIRVYPNPAAQQVYISGFNGMHVILSSMDGKALYRREGAGNMDISILPEGVYLLRITDASGRLLKNERLIKSER